MSAARSRIISYALALAVGLALTLWCFPLPLLLGQLPPNPKAVTWDFMTHITGQVYFLDQPWHRPLLRADRLVAPNGTNIALTDSAPLQAIGLKLVHALVPAVRQGISLCQGLCWLLQPVAAVFALRSAGERRVGPALAVAVMAISMPTFLFRMWHAALASHYLLLFGIGLYFRCVRPGAGWRPLAAFGALCVATFLIHPYLMMMNAGLLFAVPVTLAFRRAPELRPALLALAATGAAVVGLSWLLDYRGSGSANGFGFFSMNLLSPVFPAWSGLIPGLHPSQIDATGGQMEGYQYLGAGLILALLVLIALPEGRRGLAGFAGRHRGLVYVSAGLTIFALSNIVTVGTLPLIFLPHVFPAEAALRASGRLFWPVAYLLLVGAVLLLARLRPPVAAATLALCTALQFADAQPLRLRDHRRQAGLMTTPPQAFVRLDAAMAPYRAVVVAPRYECNSEMSEPVTTIVYLAALHGMTTNSAYTARIVPENACGAPLVRDGRSLAPGELGVAMDATDRRAVRGWLAQHARCAAIGTDILCSLSGAGLSGLPAVR